MWPPGSTALRSLIDTLRIFDSAPDIFSSSPIVLTSRRRGEAEVRMPTPPTRKVLASLTLVTMPPVSRSYQSLATMPLIEGGAPLRKVECPTAVTVAACG